MRYITTIHPQIDEAHVWIHESIEEAEQQANELIERHPEILQVYISMIVKSNKKRWAEEG